MSTGATLHLSREDLERLRDRTYCRTPALRVTSVEAAERFVTDNGLVFAFKARDSELPCLWHAACGRRDPQMPLHTHHDPAIGLVWQAKDVLPAEKRIYYGKALRRTPTMISLPLFPAFFASCGHPQPEELLDPFLDAALSPTARRILEILLDSPPLATRDLKNLAGSAGPRKRAEFDRAMAELQQRLVIAKVAETYDPFTFVWGRLDRWLETQVKESAAIRVEEGREAVLATYVERTVATTRPRIRRLFQWSETAVEQTLERLLERGAISDAVRVDGAGGWLGHRETLESL